MNRRKLGWVFGLCQDVLHPKPQKLSDSCKESKGLILFFLSVDIQTIAFMCGSRNRCVSDH